MFKRYLAGLAVLALAPMWVPLLVVFALPLLVADTLRREWEATTWDAKRRKERALERDTQGD